MPSVRRSNLPGPEAWEWIGPGSATGQTGTGGSTLAAIPRDKPRKLATDLSNATPRQLAALDVYIEQGDQRKAAKALGIGERRFHRLLYPLREGTGMTIVQLADLRRGAYITSTRAAFGQNRVGQSSGDGDASRPKGHPV